MTTRSYYRGFDACLPKQHRLSIRHAGFAYDSNRARTTARRGGCAHPSRFGAKLVLVQLLNLALQRGDQRPQSSIVRVSADALLELAISFQLFLELRAPVL